MCKHYGKMVHSCVVCKRVEHLNIHLTFHRFPKDPEKKKLWFGLVGISENDPLPKYPELCSDHFNPDDLEVRANGFRYVKKNANPRRSEGLLFLDDASSSFENIDSVPVESFDSVPGTSGSGIITTVTAEYTEKTESQTRPGDSSSSTETASEAADTEELDTEETEAASNIKNVETKKRKRQYLRYIDEMTTSDFSTPESRKKNVDILKNTAYDQRKKIHSLQMKVRHLKKRVNSLTTLTKDLKELLNP
ncbi:uncharacterized protein LOC115884933 [Sitophilus oryzae]|uniref:Uncharacterized protein LOC115884933 n=1 Tax=Sitophilus oryzae TaxID=7048 RepID=A0A6J2Y9A7_SITOR|nr:uncharacterized protein LOC115884933 [Sitophilus oryzae]